jgi:hypothetical protein
MTRQKRLIDKAKHVVRVAGLPQFFNKFGRKWHPTWQIYLAHLVYTKYRLSWPRTAKFMTEYYDMNMDWTCWRKAIRGWPLWVWEAIGRASIKAKSCDWAAIDGTCISRSDPSQHYLHRIDREEVVKRPLQEVVMIDVLRRKFLSWRIRATPRGEKCDVPYLLNHAAARPEGVLMDKGFDAEWIHQYFDDKGIWSVAPTRKNCRRGRHRKILRDCFDYALYWQRNIVESLFSAIKRLFGSHVRARTWLMQRAELSARFIAYNIGAKKTRFA